MHLPARFAAVILAFAAVLRQQRTWRHAELLLIGAILAPGKRSVTSLLRIAGLSRERRFTTYHRVLNRVVWDPRAAARLLLGLLIAAFAPNGPVVLGIDATIERRRGKRISAKGIYRDPVRSSKGHFVKASGLRWLSLMLLAPIPWAGRKGALPFLTVLARSAVCTDAWYGKPRPTFADALATVRRQFWREQGLFLSWRQAEARKLRPALRHGIAYVLCHAA